MPRLDRPFYSSFAWAYDQLVKSPVKERVDFVVSEFQRRGVEAGASVIDAGCGTGSYAIALAERGFRVTGFDASEELVAVAKNKAARAGVQVKFIVEDILKLGREPAFDGILCRGVLNDFVDDESRRSVFFSFAGALRAPGVLVLDVRDWDATAATKAAKPVFEKSVDTMNGRLTFRSVTSLRPEAHVLSASETHILESHERRDTIGFDFEMRCWTERELEDCLTSAGFSREAYYGDYDLSKPVGTTDRIIAISELSGK